MLQFPLCSPSSLAVGAKRRRSTVVGDLIAVGQSSEKRTDEKVANTEIRSDGEELAVLSHSIGMRRITLHHITNSSQFFTVRLSLAVQCSANLRKVRSRQECFWYLGWCIWYYEVLDLGKERAKREKRDYVGKIPKRRTPPPTPPVWETPVIKKKVGFIFHFRTSGTFLVFTKKSPFWVID